MVSLSRIDADLIRIIPRMVNALRANLCSQRVTIEEQAAPLLLTQGQAQEGEEENNGERVKASLADNPQATL